MGYADSISGVVCRGNLGQIYVPGVSGVCGLCMGIKRKKWCFVCCEHWPPVISMTGLCPDPVCSFLRGYSYSRLLLGSARAIISLRWYSGADPELSSGLPGDSPKFCGIREGVTSALGKFEYLCWRGGYLVVRNICILFGYLLRVLSTSLMRFFGSGSGILEQGGA